MAENKTITEGVKIRMKEIPFRQDAKDADGNDMTVEVPGVFSKQSWLESTVELTPGTDIYVKTRKPWPCRVTVGKCTSVDSTGSDKVYKHEYTFPPKEDTKRVASENRVTNSERIANLEAQLETQRRENRELMEKILAKLG
jgi:hypothetical protein